MKNKLFYIAGTLVLSTLVVVGLFFSSEHIMKKENPFVRRFIPHYIDQPISLDLEVNSYYIAGVTKDSIYLGNYTAPLLLTALPNDLSRKVEHTIRLNETQRRFRSLLVNVQDQEFYVSDGSIPIIYKGVTTDWKANAFMTDSIYFSLFQPLTSDTFLFRSQKASNGEHVLGKLTLENNKWSYELYDAVLQKQIDGVFDTDGQLVYDAITNQGIYTYYYRNQYPIYHPQTNQFSFGKTIDTTTIAQIKITQLQNGERKMSAPPLKVNAQSYAYNGRLYVQSELLGKNEPKSMWNQASIIDVYDYNKNEYNHSFYAYHEQGKTIRDYVVNDSYFFGLVGNSLVRYELGNEGMREKGKREKGKGKRE